jgi:tetratricopeptide (TPR) repeat protein
MAEERIINPMKMCNAFFGRFYESILRGPYAPHRTIEGVRKFRAMKPAFRIALLLACSLGAAPWLCAQAQPQPGGNANSSTQNSSQKKQTGNAQTPAPADSNPFPEDESTVPVMPTKDTPDLPPGSTGGSGSGHAALPAGDVDPVASPDDAAGAGDSQPVSGFSSSSSGLGGLLPGPDPGEDGPQGRHGRQQAVPEHHETAKEDESVGQYYLDGKDWHAAMSRYQSAMVLDPENPDVYWGLAESERHLGNYADARANYLKVMEYDPGSRHAKDAEKALKEPELANAKANPPASPGRQ